MDIKRHKKISTDTLTAIQEIHGGSNVDPEIKENDIFYTAVINGNIVGYVHARPEIAHILAIYVHKEYQKSNVKVGRSLLLECINSLAENGVKEIHAGVESGNEKVIGFFEKNNFEISGVSKNGFTLIKLKA